MMMMMMNEGRTTMGDQDLIALTTHELGYLLDLVPGDGADQTKDILGVPVPDDLDGFLAAGAATMLVRKLATVSDDDLLVPSMEVGIVGENLTGPAVWVEIALVSESATEGAFISFGPNSTLVLSPRVLGTFEIRFLPSGVSAGEATSQILVALLEAHAPAAGYARVVAGGADMALAVRLLEDGTLEVSQDEGAHVYSGTFPADRATVEEKICALLDKGIFIDA